MDTELALYRLQRAIAVMLLILTALALLAALKYGKPFLAPTVLALLIALTLAPLTRFLERRGLPSFAAAGAVVIGVVASVGILTYVLLPSYEEVRLRLPDLAEAVGEGIEAVNEQIADVAEAGADKVVEAVNGEKAATQGDQEAKPAIPSSGEILFRSISRAPALIATLIYMILLVFFTLAERSTLHRTMLAAAAGNRRRRHLGRAMRDMRQTVSRYLLTISMINVGLGAATAAAFTALGLPNAGLLGVAMGLANFIPYLGSAAMNVLVFAVGLLAFGNWEEALIPVAVLLVLNFLEGQILTPMVVGQTMKRSSLELFVAIAFGAWLWGAIGALIATPVLIVAHIWLERFELIPKLRGVGPGKLRPSPSARRAAQAQ
ncbi:MAG: AI-2E family transporter [Neomegalonema sp.]|nr:AI-2E family transporter [Neomegalonema sp.]